MVFYSWEYGVPVKKDSLWEALELSMDEYHTLALVGGGGKTSIMYRLADEAADKGKVVIATTTTHIFHPQDRPVIITEHADEVGGWLREKGMLPGIAMPKADGDITARKRGIVLVTGLPAGDGKLKSMDTEEIDQLKQYADVLLIEADGAKRLPVKVPGEGEPVFLRDMDAVLGCMGLDCIGKALEEVCFRKELAIKLLGIGNGSDGGFGHKLTEADAALILTSGEGTRKEVGAREYRVVLNKADHAGLLSKAVNVAREIERISPVMCAITNLL